MNNIERLLTVKLSYSETTKKFFIDFWDGDTYLVSEAIPENHALALKRELNIKIMLN